MKVNKENITKLLKNKYFYLGIFGFIFLIIIIMTFSGGKKPDESECVSGKIRDAEGACDADGNNKTSICRENCESNVGTAENKWDCKTKKCICKDGFIKCGTSGMCCKSKDCINSICCPEESQTDNGLCCGGGTTPSADKKKCESLCGPIGTTNICKDKDTCYRIVNYTQSDIDSLKDHKYTDKDDIDLYFCANNSNSYGNSTYYPNSISTYNFCMDLKDNGINSGFCYPTNDSTDQSITDAYEKNISDCKSPNIWYSFLDTTKNTNDTYKKYTKAVTLSEDLIGDFAGKYCGPSASGSIIADITPRPQDKGGGLVTDCILKSASPNTNYVSYNGQNSKCLSLQSCSKTSNIKNNSSLENNVRKIEIQDSCDNEGCNFSEYITDTPEPLKLQNNTPEYKFDECTTTSTSECNSIGLDNMTCEREYVTKNNVQKLYNCDKKIPTAYKCVENETGTSLAQCELHCKTPPTNALLYNTRYDKIYISTDYYGGDMFFTGSGSKTVMAGTREPCSNHCMDVSFETCNDEGGYNDRIHVSRGEYFFIKFHENNNFYISIKNTMNDELGQLSYDILTYAIKFQIPDNGESEKVVTFNEKFTMYMKGSIYPIKSAWAISEYNCACGSQSAVGTCPGCFMIKPIRFTVDRNDIGWIPTFFQVTSVS